MAIPKTVHYCWLSGDPFPEDIQRCIDSWKKQMPDYRFKLWDKNAFDCNSVLYTRQALEKEKYAFASDYIRLYALYTEGGIYLDSDVEVFRSFDDLLERPGFTCFESGRRIGAWIFASEKGNPLFKKLLEYYDGRAFYNESGEMDLTPNTVPVTKILVECGLKPENRLQNLENITVFPEEYFCPKNPWTGKIVKTENTYAMHLFKGAWNDVANEDFPFISEIHRYVSKFIDKVRGEKRKNVVIYGLGVVGNNVLEQLSLQAPDIKVGCILVTKYDNGWTSIDGIPIIEVCNSEMVSRDEMVLIATIPKHQVSIRETLLKYGYKNIWELGNPSSQSYSFVLGC